MDKLTWNLKPYERHRFPFGLEVVVKPMPGCPVATVAVWVRAGTKDEPPEFNGVAHFLEHMVFKGTPSLPMGAIDREVKTLGGHDNASTSSDSTEYYICLPAPHWRRALELLADLVRNPLLDAQDMEAERQVVLEEIGRKDDTPCDALHDDFLAAAFEGTPYALPVLGERESVCRITREALAGFHRRCYALSRLVLVVAGDVRPAEVMAVAERTFAPHDDIPTNDALAFDPPQRLGPCRLRRSKRVHQGYGLVGFALPDIKGTRQSLALDVAAAALAGGRACRLYRELHEERGLVSDVNVSLWEQCHAGLWYVDAAFHNGNDVEVMRIVDEHLDRLCQTSLPEAELARARRLLLSDFVFSHETSAQLADTLGRCLTSHSLEHADNYCQGIQEITAEDIRDACQTYLLPQRKVSAVLCDE